MKKKNAIEPTVFTFFGFRFRFCSLYIYFLEHGILFFSYKEKYMFWPRKSVTHIYIYHRLFLFLITFHKYLRPHGARETWAFTFTSRHRITPYLPRSRLSLTPFFRVCICPGVIVVAVLASRQSMVLYGLSGAESLDGEALWRRWIPPLLAMYKVRVFLCKTVGGGRVWMCCAWRCLFLCFGKRSLVTLFFCFFAFFAFFFVV